MKNLHLIFTISAFLCPPLLLNAQEPAGHAITRDFLMGRTHYETDTCFVPISREFTRLAIEYSYIQKETYAAYLKMRQAAERDGITLNVTSASRNFWVQKHIWEQRWSSKSGLSGEERVRASLQYISMPGTSRHHWGTDMDFCSKELKFWESQKGIMTYRWLKEHAGRYGFFQPYTSKAGGRTGYEEEKWHWSFAPLANIYLEAYKEQISSTDIKGFAGADAAAGIDIIGQYVCGIENEDYVPLIPDVREESLFKGIPLFQKNEEDSQNKASECRDMIPLYRLALENQ